VNGTLLIASGDALEALQLVQAILSKLVRRSRFCGGIAPPMLRMRRKRRSFHIAPALGLVKLKNHAPAHVHGLDRERLDSGLTPRTISAVCRSFGSAPGRIRTSDSRFRKPDRSVCRSSLRLEIRLSTPYCLRWCSPGLTASTVKLLYNCCSEPRIISRYMPMYLGER
jgi:hypothetical protein